MPELDVPALQGLIDALPFYVLLVDGRHHIVAANRAAASAVGKDAAALVGCYCPRVVHGLDEPYPGCPLEEAVGTGQSVEKDLFDERTRRHLRSSVYLTEMLTEEGERVYLHSIEDITDKRRAEEERAKLQEQLLRAQKLDGLGRLAGGIAHDFNNLLTLILNYATFAAKELEEGSPVREDVERIRRAGKRAAALTRQLLAFSRNEIVEPRVLELNDVVKDVERLLRRTIGENIDFTTDLGPSVWRVKVDPGQLEQVLLNLALNARDAMPRGGRLAVSTRNVTLGDAAQSEETTVPPGRYVEVAVSDSGAGMTEEVLSHLFEPFFTTKERGKGTGLGLATVYGIVKQAGGEVVARSTPGRGSTFRVLLPATDEPLTDEHDVRSPLDLRGRGETVLVVDDDETVRALVARILSGASYRVLEARDGGTALLRASGHRGGISLLLADVVLEGMSGKELAGFLAPLRPETRVLYMSGYPDSDIVVAGAIAPGTNFLQKPFSEERLLRRVREIIDGGPPGEVHGLGAGI
jgi:signal transduction histidine kinase/CheY-like chemotaxis protein